MEKAYHFKLQLHGRSTIRRRKKTMWEEMRFISEALRCHLYCCVPVMSVKNVILIGVYLCNPRVGVRFINYT